MKPSPQIIRDFARQSLVDRAIGVVVKIDCVTIKYDGDGLEKRRGQPGTP